jgi:hypothetical protein
MVDSRATAQRQIENYALIGNCGSAPPKNASWIRSPYASLPNPLEFAEPLAGYDMNRFRVGDYRVAFQIDQNIISLADIRQTTNSVNPLCAVSDSSLATATGGLGVVEICVPVARLGQPWLARRG